MHIFIILFLDKESEVTLKLKMLSLISRKLIVWANGIIKWIRIFICETQFFNHASIFSAGRYIKLRGLAANAVMRNYNEETMRDLIPRDLGPFLSLHWTNGKPDWPTDWLTECLIWLRLFSAICSLLRCHLLHNAFITHFMCSYLEG